MFTGKLDNDPVDIPGKKAGDEVTFHQGEISDWLIMSEDGSMVGGYTVKVLQSRGR